MAGILTVQLAQMVGTGCATFYLVLGVVGKMSKRFTQDTATKKEGKNERGEKSDQLPFCDAIVFFKPQANILRARVRVRLLLGCHMRCCLV